MAHAYTPGLRVTARAIVRRERRLPLRGQVLVRVGEAVGPQDVVARTELPGNVQAVNLASRLGVEPAQAPRTLTRPLGSDVRRARRSAAARGLFGLGTPQRAVARATACSRASRRSPGSSWCASRPSRSR